MDWASDHILYDQQQPVERVHRYIIYYMTARIYLMEIKCKWVNVVIVNCYELTEDKEDIKKRRMRKHQGKITLKLLKTGGKTLITKKYEKMRWYHQHGTCRSVFLTSIAVQVKTAIKKNKNYKTLVRPDVLYACGAWASTKADEKKLMTFETKILRRIFGPKKDTENNQYEQKTNEELRGLFNLTNIVCILKSRIAEDRIVNNVTMWKPD